MGEPAPVLAVAPGRATCDARSWRGTCTGAGAGADNRAVRHPGIPDRSTSRVRGADSSRGGERRAPGLAATVRVRPKTGALYRGYLSVSAALDRTARRGRPITRQIGAALLDAHGRPRKGRGGRILRSADPAALIPHPSARMAPQLTDRDAAVFLGYDPDDRRRRWDAWHALERLADDGVMEMERTARGTFALYAPPRPDGVET